MSQSDRDRDEISHGDTFSVGAAEYRIEEIPDEDGAIASVNPLGTDGWADITYDVTSPSPGEVRIGSDHLEVERTAADEIDGIDLHGDFSPDMEGEEVLIEYDRMTGRSRRGERTTRRAEVVHYFGSYVTVEWADSGDTARVYDTEDDTNGGLVVNFRSGSALTIGSAASVEEAPKAIADGGTDVDATGEQRADEIAEEYWAENAPPDSITQVVTAGEHGFAAVDGPFLVDKDGTKWTITVPLNEDDALDALEGDWMVSYRSLPDGLEELAESIDEIGGVDRADGVKDAVERVVMSYDPDQVAIATENQQATLGGVQG